MYCEKEKYLFTRLFLNFRFPSMFLIVCSPGTPFMIQIVVKILPILSKVASSPVTVKAEMILLMGEADAEIAFAKLRALQYVGNVGQLKTTQALLESGASTRKKEGAIMTNARDIDRELHEVAIEVLTARNSVSTNAKANMIAIANIFLGARPKHAALEEGTLEQTEGENKEAEEVVDRKKVTEEVSTNTAVEEEVSRNIAMEEEATRKKVADKTSLKKGELLNMITSALDGQPQEVSEATVAPKAQVASALRTKLEGVAMSISNTKSDTDIAMVLLDTWWEAEATTLVRRCP